ncbi:WG repeat-containing protein [Sungkyunkwania multivorans]|uniref:WG repeat-containing protein n=1 Tax=Sungkyunkwania multivorans TaxID=1173618 RepID=A0ABW3D158_9FLAO
MRLIAILILGTLLATPLWSQEHKGLEAVGELSEGLIAIKKDGKWGFIDTENNMVIDFRDDIVGESYKSSKDRKAPKFKNDRCLIMLKKEGIPYYGYIDRTGKTVIPPQYLNATNFHEGYALAVKPYKTVRGRNKYLDKEIIQYNFAEELIDVNGNYVKSLKEMPHILMSEKKFKKPFSSSHFISSKQIAVMTQKEGWQVFSLDKSL